MNQNNFEHLKDMVEQDKITPNEANIRKVEMQRVLLVTHLPTSVRKSLNQAVKDGRLCHEMKDGNRPEAYYKTGFEYLAKQKRIEYEKMIKKHCLDITQ